MKLNTKLTALTVAIAMGAGMLVGCNKGGNKPAPAPKYLVNVPTSADYRIDGIVEDRQYVEGAAVSFTVEVLNEDKELTAAGYSVSGTRTAVDPVAGVYTFSMPAQNVSLYVTLRNIERYALSKDGDLKVDGSPVTFSLVLGTDPVPTWELTATEGGTLVSINNHEVTPLAAGDVTFAAIVEEQQVATLECTIAPSELMSIKDALDAAILEAPCNSKGGNLSSKTTTDFTIAGKIVYKSKWKEGTSSGFDLDVIIDDGTEATILIVHSNKSSLAEAEAQAEYVVGDSIKTTCKFTNYYGLLEGISTTSTADKQYSLYPDQLIKIEKTFATQYLQNAVMTGAQLDAYGATALANQSASAGAYTDIKYVTLEDVTYDASRDMDGPDKDVEVGGFNVIGSQYAINASEKSTIDIDEVDGHVSTLVGLLTGVNTNYKTSKMYAFEQTPLAVETITFVDGDSKTIFLNNPVKLEYTTLPAGSYGPESWFSGNPDKVSVENGVITGLDVGDSDITLYIATNSGNVQKSILIHVSGEQHACTSVELNKDTLTLVKGASEKLTAAIQPDNCTDPVSWSSSDTTVATVDQEGNVTAASDKTGTATITVLCGELFDTCTVTVKQQTMADLANATIGDPVDVYGIIVGQYPVTSKYGLWIADGDHGIYLHTGLKTGMSIGSQVHVVGTVAQNYGGKQVSFTTFELADGDHGVAPLQVINLTESVISTISSAIQASKATVTGVVKTHTNINSTTAHHTITLTIGNETFKVYVHKDNCGATVLTDFARATVGSTVTISGYITANKSGITDFSELTKSDYQLINPTLDSVVGPTLTGVSVTPKTASVNIADGAQQKQFNVEPQPAGADLGTVTWSISPTLAGVSIDNSGLVSVTADAVEEDQTATFTVTATAGGFSDTATLTVKNDTSGGGADFAAATTLTTGKYVIGALGSSDTSKYYYLPAPTEAVAKNPATAGPLTDPVNELTVTDAWDVTVDEDNHIVISYTSNATTYYLEATNTAQGITIKTSQTANSYWTLSATGLQFNDGGTRYLATYNDGSFRYYGAPLGSGQSMANVFYQYIGA